ncbi:MAG TPA: nitrite/sulfite reductase [Candidatus Limnocylindrales bacterium]|nr:nitrite/sulfite reductase [Candidatus Limnocylindrales bacterium]
MLTWKEALADRMPPELAREIDIYETQIELKRQGKIDDKVFAETRLRRGTYGQRYDNGQRDDGTGPKELEFPDRSLTKGPETLWHAPGMQRIKIPFGGLTARQLEVLADLAEEYSDAICHVTTRQDIQLHFVHIEDTPDLMRRLAAEGITTREACGNSIRNVTGCPLAGVCRAETFDVTPYAKATSRFLLGHPDCQDLGRKFKIAFSGCAENPCGLVFMHDLGFIARTRVVDGHEQRGFETYVGGGLGAVPYQAKLYDEFIPESEILPLAQAIARVFARLGEKKNRARARMKFLVAKLGFEEFRRLVEEERRILPADDAWTAFLSGVRAVEAAPVIDGGVPGGADIDAGRFEQWQRTNIYRQRQPGYVVATVTLPLGDATSFQMRRLADIARRFCGDSIRATVDQNILLRWVREADLPALYAALEEIGLGEPGAGSIVDITACPGTDTCKLGIASSRGLAAELQERLVARSIHLDQAVRDLHIKISGCFNSCGQHHVADLGFYGVSRNVGGRTVPHFQVVLGGRWDRNGGAYGLAIGAVPSKRIPDVVDRMTERYVRERNKDERFQDFCARIGKRELKALLSDLMEVPAYDKDRDFYSDWRDPREFTLGDLGVGECAGEVVSLVEFSLAESERRAFEAQLLLESGQVEAADHMAYSAMIEAARALVRVQYPDLRDDAEEIVREFRTRFYDTELFFDKYAGGRFAQFLFKRHEDAQRRSFSEERVRQLIEEASLFIEAAHACDAKLASRGVMPAVSSSGDDPARVQ